MEKLKSPDWVKSQKINEYTLQSWQWMYRVFVNLWLQDPKYKNSMRQIQEALTENNANVWLIWLKEWDKFILDKNFVLHLVRKNEKIFNFQLPNEAKTNFDESLLKELTQTKEFIKNEKEDITNYLVTEYLVSWVSKNKIEEILKELKKNNTELKSTDILNYKNWVFFITRNNILIFYHAIDKASAVFWKYDEEIVKSDDFEDNDFDEIEKQLQELVMNFRKQEIEENKWKSKKNETKKLQKTSNNNEVKEKVKKVKEVLKTKKQTSLWEVISDFYKILWIKKVTVNEIKSLVYFESHFEQNNVSYTWAKWLFQITSSARNQANTVAKTINNTKINSILKKSSNIKNPVYNSLVWLVYISWVENNFLEDDHKLSWKKIINTISKNRLHFKKIIWNYLEKKNIEIDDTKFNSLINKLKTNPHMMEKFLVFRKYNADHGIKNWEIFEHHNYFWLVVLYISEFCKTEVKEREIMAKIVIKR